VVSFLLDFPPISYMHSSSPPYLTAAEGIKCTITLVTLSEEQKISFPYTVFFSSQLGWRLVVGWITSEKNGYLP
jgi:hypothetical protein